MRFFNKSQCLSITQKCQQTTYFFTDFFYEFCKYDFLQLFSFFTKLVTDYSCAHFVQKIRLIPASFIWPTSRRACSIASLTLFLPHANSFGQWKLNTLQMFSLKEASCEVRILCLLQQLQRSA